MDRSRWSRWAAMLPLLAISFAPAGAQQSSPPPFQSYTYFYEELLADESSLPPALKTLRADDPLLNPCRPAVTAQTPAVIVPLAIGLFRIFANVLDTHLRDREKQRLQRFSQSSASLRTYETAPLTSDGPAFRCLIVDRVIADGTQYRSGSLYVIGLRQVGRTAFTAERVAARVDSITFPRTQGNNAVNTTVGIAFQMVTLANGQTQLVSPPAYSVSFDDLPIGGPGVTYSLGPSRTAQGRRPSAVMPIPVDAAAPTSVAAALTEAHVSLSKETQRVALEQANRTLLIAAMGEVLKAGITD